MGRSYTVVGYFENLCRGETLSFAQITNYTVCIPPWFTQLMVCSINIKNPQTLLQVQNSVQFCQFHQLTSAFPPLNTSHTVQNDNFRNNESKTSPAGLVMWTEYLQKNQNKEKKSVSELENRDDDEKLLPDNDLLQQQSASVTQLKNHVSAQDEHKRHTGPRETNQFQSQCSKEALRSKKVQGPNPDKNLPTPKRSNHDCDKSGIRRLLFRNTGHLLKPSAIANGLNVIKEQQNSTFHLKPKVERQSDNPKLFSVIKLQQKQPNKGHFSHENKRWQTGIKH